MKNANEKNMKNTEMSCESIQCERIENLYNQMLNTAADDIDYRAKLASELLRLQREEGSFRVIEDCRCDSDIRVAYIYFPTYYATAALIYAMTFDGSDAEVKTALSRGLAVACERHLVGHGYDATAQQLEALRIYKKANLYSFLQKYGKEYPDFQNTICQVIENYRTRLSENKTVSDWAVDFRSQFETEVSDFDTSMVRNVWYASYGSNLCFERFMRYIHRCTDTTAPVESKPITIEHNIYFSGSSTTWEGKGTAFLDDSCPGMALGRMYLITAEQFAQVQYFEGPKYSKKVLLGTEGEFPIYTFTAPSKRTDVTSPSANYFNTVLTGLRETYPELSEITLVSYLLDSGIVDTFDRKILSFVRSSEHGVSLQTISDHTMSVAKTKTSVKKLVELRLLKQDRRSVAAGHRVTNLEAIFFTSRDRRDVIAMLLLMHR